MMKKHALIHISDIHVYVSKDLKGNPNKDSDKFWLSSDLGDENNQRYISHFCDYVRKKFPEFTFSLIVTGDITNAGEQEEFNSAKAYIEKIAENLSITTNDILIIPGDHDINREDNKLEFRTLKEQKKTIYSYECNDKLKNFSAFYYSLKDKKFQVDSAIFDKIVIEEIKTVVLASNSTYKIDYEGGLGFINSDLLEKDLNQIIKKNKDYNYIIAFHHNIFSSYEDKLTGQWDNQNRNDVLRILEKYKIKCMFYGNEHTRDSKTTSRSEDNMFISSESGCFSSKKGISASFKIYVSYKEENKISLINNIYNLLNTNKVEEPVFGVWNQATISDISELSEFVLYEQKQNIDRIIETIPESESRSAPKQLDDNNTKNDGFFYKNIEFQNKITQIIKEEKIFHSGHFHWSETSRAHNWIDISKLVSKRKNLSIAQDSIIDVIDYIKKDNDFDCILSLGIEGNIIASKAYLKYRKPFSFLPYSYRYDQHPKYEKQIEFDQSVIPKNVLIITDVVNDGRTIRKLINERESLFFSNVDKIFVVTLIYTGNKTNNMLSCLNKFPPIANNDFSENRIDFYSVVDIFVEKCPYGDNYKQDCIIVRENLGCIYKFYTDYNEDLN